MGGSIEKGSIQDHVSQNGWFFGFFSERTQLRSSDLECAVMDIHFEKTEEPHWHEYQTEITYCIEGKLNIVVYGSSFKLDGERRKMSFELNKGEYMVIFPGVIIQNITSEKDTKIFVVKFPSISNDKHYLKE